jgi:hypothetical protein
MQKVTLHSWSKVQRWLEQYGERQKQFAFRGQSDSNWLLQTSLARHFVDNHVDEHQWRRRELKMYWKFRERLLETCQGMHEAWEELDILSLMQHYGAPTRLLDFTYDPKVALAFALEDSRGDSAIWVVDRDGLERRRKDKKLLDYCGPMHRPKYDVFHKDEEKKYRLVGSILDPKLPNDRLAAQQGCFLVPGSISRIVSPELVHAKVSLSRELVLESLRRLQEQGYDREHLFPNLEQLAKEAKRFSVVDGADYPCDGIAGAGS